MSVAQRMWTDPASYVNLDVEYIRGKSPELVMEKDDGKVDRIPVDKWRTEDIEEFLKARLQNDA